MQLVFLRHALDGQHFGAVCLNRQHGAGLDRQAVHMDGAGAALRDTTSELRADKTETVAENPEEWRRRIGNVDLVLLAVDFETKHWLIQICLVARLAEYH